MTRAGTTGRCFLSYRRTHVEDIALVETALRLRGIPTWIDTCDLLSEPTEAELRRVISHPETSCAVIWLTPSVVASPMMRSVEIPELLRRHRDDSSFFVVPVLSDGLEYGDVASLLGTAFGGDAFARWNLIKTSKPLSSSDAVRVANIVLERRLRTVGGATAGEPLKLRLQARARPGFDPGFALDLDWSSRFDPRRASRDAWDGELLPALRDVADAIGELTQERPWTGEGLLGMPGALALGRAFPTTRRVPFGWWQGHAGRTSALWSHAEPEEHVSFSARAEPYELTGDDLALVVSLTDDARPAFDRGLAGMPSLRAVVDFRRTSFDHDLSAGKAAYLVRSAVECLCKARASYRVSGAVHVVIAGPVGFGVLLGQALNTFPLVAAYEYCGESDLPYVLATELRQP